VRSPEQKPNGLPGIVLCYSQQQEATKKEWKADPKMQISANNKMKTREQLKAKRNRLLEEYFKEPMNTRLAIEIRLIDDRVAEITEMMVQQRKSGIEQISAV